MRPVPPPPLATDQALLNLLAAPVPARPRRVLPLLSLLDPTCAKGMSLSFAPEGRGLAARVAADESKTPGAREAPEYHEGEE